MLKLAYIGTHLSSYLADEYQVFEKSIKGLKNLAKTLGFELSSIHTHVSSRQEAQQIADTLEAQSIDFVLLQNTTFAMGDLVLEFANRSFRLGIWATEEPVREGAIPLNNFVSMNLQAGILRRYVKPQAFKWFYGLPEHPWFAKRLEPSLAALRGIKHLSHAKIGLIGGIAPTFYNIQFDERKLRQNLGVEIERHELSEIFTLVNQQQAESIRQISLDMLEASGNRSELSEKDLQTSAAIYLALKTFASLHHYDALAVSDWPAFQTELDIHPGMAFSYLDDTDGIPVASEGDVLGAISMLCMNKMNAGKSLLLDMNDLDFERDAVLMWHCGGSPLSFADDRGIIWKNHSTLGRKTSNPPMGAVADYSFKPQAATIMRLGDDARELFVLDAEIIASPYPGFDGSRGWVSKFRFDQEALSLADLVNTIMVEGIEHHFILGAGNHSDSFHELAAWLDIRIIKPTPYKPYLQRFEKSI